MRAGTAPAADAATDGPTSELQLRPGDAQLTDAAIVTYSELFADPATAGRSRIAACPQSSATLLTQTLAASPEPELRAQVWANPSCPDELAHAALDRLVAGRADSGLVGLLAHRAAAERRDELVAALHVEHGAWLQSLLGNQHLPAKWIHKHHLRGPHFALQNPRTPARTLNRILSKNTGLAYWAAGHPDVGIPSMVAALGQRAGTGRVSALRNPALTMDALRGEQGIEQRYLDEHGLSAGPFTDPWHVICERLGEWNTPHPADDHVAALADPAAPLRADLAVHLATVDREALEAAHALIGGGFSGTVAELFAVAATFAR